MSRKIILVVLCICLVNASFSVLVNASDADKTVAGMRMKPIIDAYNVLTETQINNQAKKFPDISDHYAKPYVAKMTAVSIIAGYPEGLFGPNDTLLACQFLTMTVKALGFTPERLPGDPYWKPFVDIALQQGLIFEGEIKDYTSPLSRELAAVIAFRTLMLYEARPTGSEIYYDYNVAKITDYAKITDKYKDDVIMSFRMGLIIGSNNLFVPQGTLTRAQGCIIVNKLIDSNIRIASVPQPNEIISFKNGDWSEYYFPGSNPNKEYTFMPGSFPLNEVYDVVKTLVNSKRKVSGGYLVQGYDEKTQVVTFELYKDKAMADKFNFEDPRMPTTSVYLDIWTDKIFKQGELTDKNSGYLYSLDVYDVLLYNSCMKEYFHEALKTLFGAEADKVIALHDKYLNYAINGQKGGYEIVIINGRQIEVSGGNGDFGTGFHFYVWARGAIK